MQKTSTIEKLSHQATQAITVIEEARDGIVKP